MNIYAIGDVHGCYDKLMQLMRVIDDRYKPGYDDKFIFLGDYCDRGPDSKRVIDHFIQWFNSDSLWTRPICLQGNHEDLLLRALADKGVGDRELFLLNGGGKTLDSYNPDWRMSMPWDIYFPPEHLEFFRNLKLYHQEDGYIFVHAGLKPGVPLAEQDPADLMWIRNEFIDSEADFGARVIFGHTPRDYPLVMKNKIGIDTGAVFDGKLTCLKIDGNDLEFISV